MKRLLAALIALAIATPAAAADKLTLLLDWFVNPDHAPIIVAQEKGYFAEAGLEVTLVEPADPNDPPKLVAAGQADIAITYQPNLYLQVEEGLPLARFAALIDTPLNILLALHGRTIRTIEDLKGKRIGYSVGGFEEVILKTMLERHGLTLNDVELVNVNFSLAPSLLNGQVDAVIGAYRNFELNILGMEEQLGLAFYPEQEGVPIYDELIFVAKRDAIASDTRFARFTDAIERATAFLVNNHDEAWALVIKNHPKMNDELGRRAYYDSVFRFAHSPGALDERRYARFAQYLKDQGLITETKPVSAYAVRLD